MNIRPRCREWLPLSTQQLRLRNLQAIQGVNVEISGSASSKVNSICGNTQPLLYYTLHHHPDNEPFYQSEKLALRKHLNIKWAEIQCSEILKSNANCICIKVWACINKTENSETKEKREPVERSTTKKIKEPTSALSLEFVKLEILSQPSDSLLFKWAVYFSGLIPLSQNIDIKCCANSLIFQMNDEYFASPHQFSTESLRGQLALNYDRYSASVPKCSVPTPDEFTINSPQVSRSSSPIAVDWQKDLLRMSKTRYVFLNCLRSEVSSSYELRKLLKLQQLQRQRLRTQREIEDMKADIKRLSLRCITEEQLLTNPRTTSFNSSSLKSTLTASNYHSMGRTLSLLLSEQQRIDPHELLKAQKLQQQIETLKSKKRLLISAQEIHSIRITHLKEQLNEAATSRRQLQTMLTERQRKLQDEELKLELTHIQQLELYKHKRSITQRVERIMFSLCLELRDIYPIDRSRHGLHTICDIPVQNMTTHSAQSAYISENITPMALSASLGYVAHLTQMISVILNCPLRNPIIHEGSRTRIIDIIKDIPSYTSRVFPLYSRCSILTKPVKCAINLLNQNIGQLYFSITGQHCDIRTTIANLENIFAKFDQIEQNKSEIDIDKSSLTSNNFIIKEINSCDDIDSCQHFHHNDMNYQQQTDSQDRLHVASRMSDKYGEEYNLLSKSQSSDDLNHMILPAAMNHRRHNVPVFSLTTDKCIHESQSLHPIDIEDHTVLTLGNSQRSCRSDGSYTDSENEICQTTPIKSFSNSDSNLTSL